MGNPLYKRPLDSGGKKPTRHYSDMQEKAVAKAIGGKQTPNSGATPFVKGDVVTKQWLIECKTKCSTKQKTITVHKEWFDKNLAESIYMKKDYSAVVFNFGPREPNIYCIEEGLFQRMKYALELLDQQESEEDN